MAADEELTEPVLDGASSATPDEKFAGLLEQIEYDAATWERDKIADLLRQRLTDAGLSIPDTQFVALVVRLGGSAH